MEQIFTCQQRVFLKKLQKIGAIKIRESVETKDGSLSPIYIDLRKPVFNNPMILSEIGNFFYAKIKAVADPARIQCVVGVPEAGTPLAVATSLSATLLDSGIIIPFIMLRSQAKKRGTQKGFIIGEVNPNWEYTILDDVITTNKSKQKAIRKLKEEGINVKRVIVAFDRQQGGADSLRRLGCEFYSLFKILDVVAFFAQEQLITQEQYKEVVAFINAYQFN